MNVAQKARDVMLVPLAEKPTVKDIEDALKEAQRDGAEKMRAEVKDRIDRKLRVEQGDGKHPERVWQLNDLRGMLNMMSMDAVLAGDEQEREPS